MSIGPESGMSLDRRQVSTGNDELSYLDVGTGPVALFVHGIGTNANLWRHALPSLASERRCVALDLPMHGESDVRRDQDWTLGGLAAVIARFCEKLGLGEVDLVANDTGGAIAQVFAARSRHRLRTLALTNCDTSETLPPEPLLPTVELARQGKFASVAPSLAADPGLARRSVFGAGFEKPEQVSDATLRAYLEPVFGTRASAEHFEKLLLALRPEEPAEAEAVLSTLSVPTVFVWGTADENFPLASAHRLRDLIPGAGEVVEIPGGKLFLPEERAPELVTVLRKHWNRTAPTARR
ncbi:alpha/beta hydrolase [Saccharomonospora sp. NPDC006951]